MADGHAGAALRRLLLVMKLWAPRSLQASIECQARRFFPLETGGVLLGWRDGPDVIAASYIGPGPRALHGRHLFVPDHAWQLSQIRAAFKASGGDLDYLGDWHTHPGGIAAMSNQDRATLAKLNRRVRGAAMLIAAGRDDTWSFGAWTTATRALLRPRRFEAFEVVAFDAPAAWPRWPTESDAHD